MTTNLDLSMIRRTLEALNVATDDTTRALLYVQLDSLRAGCDHKRTKTLRRRVTLHVLGAGTQICDILECLDCLAGLTRPRQRCS
jgi:hypothetical protein